MNEKINAELKAWIEWKEKCDIQRCLKENRSILNKYADEVLNKTIGVISYSKLEAKDFCHGSAFAYFQMHAINKKYQKSRNKEVVGKTYKDGMFFIASQNNKEPTIKLLKNYFLMYLKDAIRENFADEINEEFLLSLNNKIGEEEVELIDFIESDENTEEQVILNEILEIAKNCCDKIFEKLSFEDKAILLADILDLKISTSQALQEITKKKKTAISDRYNQIFKKRCFLKLIEEAYPNNDKTILEKVYDFCFEHSEMLPKKILLWGKAENRCRNLFIESEEMKKVQRRKKNEKNTRF